MARQAGANATAKTKTKSATKRVERRLITFYLLRGITSQPSPESKTRTKLLPAHTGAQRLMQLKIGCHGRDHVHRSAAIRKWTHAPLLHCRNRGISQSWRATQNL